MADKHALQPDTPDQPARQMWRIIPGEGEVSPLPKAIRANTSGSIVLRAVDSDADVTIDVQAGEIVAVRALIVRSSTVPVIHGMA